MPIVTELEKKITPETEAKHFDKWSKQARYMGNGIYHNHTTGEFSTDTRELLLMYVAKMTKVDFKLD
jgi:hypothetical protein